MQEIEIRYHWMPTWLWGMNVARWCWESVDRGDGGLVAVEGS